MTGKKTAEMDRWLEEKIRWCGRRSQTLRVDDRADEAAFEKIRANVYDIFRTVLSSAAEKWRCWHETRRATGASNRNKNPCPVRAPGRGSL